MVGRTNPLCQLSLAELRLRTSEKWQAYPRDVIPLFVAEMDVLLAEPVARAITDAVTRGDTGYPAGTAYAEALAEFSRKRWGWEGVAAEHTVMMPNVVRGIAEILDVLSPVGAVVINSPVYPPFYRFADYAGRRHIEEAPLGSDHRIDFNALEVAFRRAVKHGPQPVYLLCSPHNPTGTVHATEELMTVATLAVRYGVRVIADEIHAPLVMPGNVFVPYLSVPGSEDGMALFSASKGWNLAGLRAAIALAGPAAVADLDRIPDWVREGPSHLGVIAHAAALRDGIPWLDNLLDGLDANRRLLLDLLGRHLPAIRYRPGEGTYFAWLDCRDLGLRDDPAAAFLEQGKVALASGSVFGTGGAGHVRLNLASSPDLIAEAVRRMAAATTPT